VSEAGEGKKKQEGIMGDAQAEKKLDYFPQWIRTKADFRDVDHVNWLGTRSPDDIQMIFKTIKSVYPNIDEELSQWIADQEEQISHAEQLREHNPSGLHIGKVAGPRMPFVDEDPPLPGEGAFIRR
jgi:hypothetical protein